jgi:uncharacterized membrane protein YhaH (DUF805 family)
MADSVQLVFFGEVIDGFAVGDVKRSLGDLFKLDEARLAQMFSGSRVVIKQAIDADAAAQHVARFARIGARVRVERPASAPLPVAPAPVARPASVAPLKPASSAEAEIVCPKCGERQSKQLLCRACATNMEMGIAAKLEAEQQARAAAEEQRAARRAMRPGGSRAVAGAPGTGLWGLGFKGRIGRLAYATAGFLLLAVIVQLVALLVKRPSGVRVAVAGLGMLAVLFVSVRLTVLRCHDCNRSGWWSVVLVVPYVGEAAGLLLSFLPGSKEANDFGEPPAPGKWPLLAGAIAVLVLSAVMAGSSLLRELHLSGGAAPAEAAVSGEASEQQMFALLPPSAHQAFRGEYTPAPLHKAFAVSAGGAWGWKSGEASANQAVAAALAICSANRQSYTPECVLVSVDGQWLVAPK